MDKTEIIIVSLVIGIFLFVFGMSIGACWEKVYTNELRMEALHKGYAEYVADEAGKPVFTWKENNDQN